MTPTELLKVSIVLFQAALTLESAGKQRLALAVRALGFLIVDESERAEEQDS